MTLLATVAPHLPYLRRFARALTGNQAVGDSLAMQALGSIAGEDISAAGDATRTALFAALLRHWKGSAATAQRTLADDIRSAADRSLEAMTPLSRVAFLLHAAEGLSIGEIAEVLTLPTAEIPILLRQAGIEIAENISTAVLIIEDDPIIAMDLEGLVLDLGHAITHIARTRAEAVAAIPEHVPGLVLADIHLADGSSGLDAVQDILAVCEVPVIFITAYPERLLTGSRPEPTFLITKPFRTDMVRAIISQALFFNRKSSLVP